MNAITTALVERVPFVGVMVPAAVAVVGTGAVLLTSLGLRRFERAV